MALSSSILTKSFVAASSRSKSLAVTTTSSFSAKRLAVSFMMLNATGSISLRTTSYLSSTIFSSLSIWLKMSSLSSIGVSSTVALSSAIFAFSSLTASCSCCCSSFVRALSWSFVRALISGYAAFTFSTIGWMCFISRVDLSPNSDFSKLLNPILYVFLFFF